MNEIDKIANKLIIVVVRVNYFINLTKNANFFLHQNKKIFDAIVQVTNHYDKEKEEKGTPLDVFRDNSVINDRVQDITFDS